MPIQKQYDDNFFIIQIKMSAIRALIFIDMNNALNVH